MNEDIKALTATQVFVRLFIIIIVIVLVVGLINSGLLSARITPVSKLVQDKESKHYVNDLYISDGRHYDYMLDDKEKKIYDSIYSAILARKSYTTLNFEDFNYSAYNATYTLSNAFERVFQALSMDHPELIYYSPASNSFSYTMDSKLINFSFTYSLSQEEYEKAIKYIQVVIDDIKSKTEGKSEYEICKIAYDWVASKNIYGDINGPLSHSAYSVFNLKEYPVCEGYGKGMQILLQNLGINSIYVVGRSGGSHGWNIVQIEGKYYNLDMTNSYFETNYPSTNNVSYAGFLFGNNSNYSILWDKMVPKINGSKYQYFKYNKLEYTFKNTPEGYTELRKMLAECDKSRLELKIKNMSTLKRSTQDFIRNMGKSYTWSGRFNDLIYIEK